MRHRPHRRAPWLCAPGSSGALGKFVQSQRDSADVDCDTCRQALSARLDGELLPVSNEHTEKHLAECSACRSWNQRASDLSRTLRVRPVHPVPDMSRSVVQAARSRPKRPVRWPRVLLACVAVCQVVLGVTQVPGLPGSPHISHTDRTLTAGHLFNESTAWNIALGLGLLWCTYRVRASAGLIPVLSAFLVILTGFCVGDFISATVSIARLASHGLLVLGLIFLLLVQRNSTHWRPQPVTGQEQHQDNPTGRDGDLMEERAHTDDAHDHRPLPPAGIRRAG